MLTRCACNSKTNFSLRSKKNPTGIIPIASLSRARPRPKMCYLNSKPPSTLEMVTIIFSVPQNKSNTVTAQSASPLPPIGSVRFLCTALHSKYCGIIDDIRRYCRIIAIILFEMSSYKVPGETVLGRQVGNHYVF